MLSIVAVLFFFTVAGFVGLTITKIFRLKFNLIGQLAVGEIIGVVGLTQLIFWQSWLLGFKPELILLTLTGFLVFSSWFWQKNGWWQIKKLKLGKKPLISWLIFLAFWSILFALIWKQMLIVKTDGLYAGWINIWGDWAAHLSYTTSFAFGDNFPPEMPLLSQTKFSYPFLADFLSAILIKLGSSLTTAMLLPSLVLSLSLAVILTVFGQELTNNLKIGRLTTWLFLFNGGLGFYWWLKDLQSLGLKAIINNLPQEYTHLKEPNIEWINIITSQVIPQRGFLLGFPIAILVYILLWRYFNRKNRLNLAGWLTGLLPLIHVHSFIVILAVAGVLMLIELGRLKNKKKTIKNWLEFFLPAIIIGLPQVIYFYLNSLSTQGFIKWRFGWQAEKTHDPVWWFWLKNLGLMSVWILWGMKLASRQLRWFSLPFWLVFISANLFLFQPWEWDNTKFFVHWYLLASLLAALSFKRLSLTKKFINRLMVGMLFTLTILSGFLDVWRLTQSEKRQIRFFTNEQLTLAQWVRNNTAPTARFLTADNHDHWLPTLTGRKTLLGYRGWLWTYGLNYSRQEQAVKAIFSGSPNAQDLLNQYQIDYIVVGPMEKELGINENFFKDNFPVNYRLGTTQIYLVVD